MASQQPASKLLATIPGVGIMGASALRPRLCDPNLFRSGREFAAWLGVTPRQHSSGGKERLGRTSKRGDKYIGCFCKDAVVHQPTIRRAARRGETMNGHRPKVWISDRYSAQQNRGAAHQTCLAHLARDTAFALEHGSDDLPLRFKLWFGKVFNLAADIARFKASTIASKKRALERRLAALLAATTGCDLARELQAKIRRAQHQLLTFCDHPGEVQATNNGSERKLRPCVIQRKVTNGYRAMWAAQAEADVRTTVDTARLKGAILSLRRRRAITASTGFM